MFIFFHCILHKCPFRQAAWVANEALRLIRVGGFVIWSGLEETYEALFVLPFVFTNCSTLVVVLNASCLVILRVRKNPFSLYYFHHLVKPAIFMYYKEFRIHESALRTTSVYLSNSRSEPSRGIVQWFVFLSIVKQPIRLSNQLIMLGFSLMRHKV